MSELYQRESRVAGDRLLSVAENFLRFHQLPPEGEHMFGNKEEGSIVWMRYSHTQLTDIIFTTRSTVTEDLSHTRVIRLIPSQYGYGVLKTDTNGMQHDDELTPGITTDQTQMRPLTPDVVDDLEWELAQPDLKVAKKRRESKQRPKRSWRRTAGSVAVRGFER